MRLTIAALLALALVTLLLFVGVTTASQSSSCESVEILENYSCRETKENPTKRKTFRFAI